MDLVTVIFWIIAVILVGSALLVVTQRNIVHSALALVIVFAMAAGIYLLLNAEFIAIVQILIYAGAVTILILFALMLTRTSNIQLNSNPRNNSAANPAASTKPYLGSPIASLTAPIASGPKTAETHVKNKITPATAPCSDFGKQLMPFELMVG